MFPRTWTAFRWYPSSRTLQREGIQDRAAVSTRRSWHASEALPQDWPLLPLPPLACSDGQAGERDASLPLSELCDSFPTPGLITTLTTKRYSTQFWVLHKLDRPTTIFSDGLGDPPSMWHQNNPCHPENMGTSQFPRSPSSLPPATRLRKVDGESICNKAEGAEGQTLGQAYRLLRSQF